MILITELLQTVAAQLMSSTIKLTSLMVRFTSTSLQAESDK